MHINSDFQRFHSERLRACFYEIPFVEEMVLDGKKRIDLGTADRKYGIEIKSSLSDLKSGSGLNQNRFVWGYVVCPKKILYHTIGWLYMNGFEDTGIISILDDDRYFLAKPAMYNSVSNVPWNIGEFLCGDEIYHTISNWLENKKNQ